MKIRRMIALLLCSLYLVAMGAPALSSLLCPCVAQHKQQIACCHACCHHHTTSCDTHFDSDCCDDRHQLEVVLYTSLDEKQERRVHLPETPSSALFVASISDHCAPLPAVVTEGASRDHLPSLAGGYFATAGLRAPPVCA